MIASGMAQRQPSRGRIIGVSIAAFLMLVTLIALGVWQIERLSWKLGLIERLDARVHATPVDIGKVVDAYDKDGDVEYMHVAATGRFHHELERYLYAMGEGDWGWDVITPLELPDHRYVLVNRGYVPRQQQDPATRKAGLPDGPVTVTGLVRRASDERPWYNPNDNPARNEWYWPDREAIARSALPQAVDRVLPFLIEADRAAAATPPNGGVTLLDLPNRHLEYVVTWLGLAVTLLVIYAIWLWRALRPPRG